MCSFYVHRNFTTRFEEIKNEKRSFYKHKKTYQNEI